MQRVWISMAMASGLLISVGCISKAYVRNQVMPLIDKVNQLDDETAKNTKGIRAVDSSITQAAQSANEKAEVAMGSSRNAEQQATIAQERSDKAMRRVTNLSNTVSQLDDYRVIKEVSVHFESGELALDATAKQKLDEIGSQLPKSDYVVTVVGATDATGSKEDNYWLSERRARQVMTYLATIYKVPAYKMHVVGLGPDKPVATNDDAPGRAQNRRADVELLAVGSSNTSPSGNAQSDEDSEDEARQ